MKKKDAYDSMSNGEKLFIGFKGTELTEGSDQQGNNKTHLKILFNNLKSNMLGKVVDNFLKKLNHMEDDKKYNAIDNHGIEFRIQLQHPSISALNSTHYLIMSNEDSINIYLDCYKDEVEDATLKLKAYQATLI